MLKRLTLPFALLLLAAASTATAAPVATETYTRAVAQIDSGKVTAAVIDPLTHDVKLTFSDGSSQLVIYPPRDEHKLSRRLHAHGATVRFPRHAVVKHATPAVHHHIRYIAGGVLVVVIILGGGLFIVTSRQSEIADPPQAPTPAPTAPAPAPTTETTDENES